MNEPGGTNGMDGMGGLDGMDEIRCTICLEELDSSESMEISCGHSFHKTCILNWFRSPMSSGNCPLCNDNPHSRNTSSQRNTWGYYSNTNQRLIDQRFSLIKKSLTEQNKKSDKKGNEYKKLQASLKSIDKISEQKKEIKELEKKHRELQKDEHYKQIKNDLSKTWKDKWKLQRSIITKQIKILSKYPCIFQ